MLTTREKLEAEYRLDLQRRVHELEHSIAVLTKRLDAHLDSHKRLFPAALGPNPEDPRR